MDSHTTNRSPNYKRKNNNLPEGLSPVIYKTNRTGAKVAKKTYKIPNKIFKQNDKNHRLSCYNGWYEKSDNPLFMDRRPLQYSCNYPELKNYRSVIKINNSEFVLKDDLTDNKSEKLESVKHPLSELSSCEPKEQCLEDELIDEKSQQQCFEDEFVNDDEESQGQCFKNQIRYGYEDFDSDDDDDESDDYEDY